MVIINPNNPSGELFNQEMIMALHKKVILFGGWLIVDEAFMDVCPSDFSVASKVNAEGLFVLRSIGKFFGLAGIRAFFLL